MFTRDIGIDLGTANTRICVRGRAGVTTEPSVVAYDVRSDEVRAVGSEAKEMIGRTPGSLVALRPLRGGVIADYDVTAAMLREFIREATRGNLFSRVRVLISVPAGVTEVEVRAVFGAAKQAGAAEVDLMEAPLAAALGAGLPVNAPAGSMLVDIGAGTTEIAVVSLGGMVTGRTLRVAGDDFDRSITSYIRRKYNLLIGERTAEEIKIALGSAAPTSDEGELQVRGRGALDGLPGSVILTSDEVREALRDDIRQIVEGVRGVLEKTPPELSADIMDRGITLSGGGAYLRGLDRMLESETEMPVTLAPGPMDCAALGLAKRLATATTFDTYVTGHGKKFR